MTRDDLSQVIFCGSTTPLRQVDQERKRQKSLAWPWKILAALAEKMEFTVL
jgi:hypothetical protein